MRALSRKDHVVSENEIAHSYPSPSASSVAMWCAGWPTIGDTPGARCDTWVHRTHAASVHTYHYIGITCCCCCCLVHMLPAGASPDRHRARSCPSVLDVPVVGYLFPAPLFEMRILVMGRDLPAIPSQIMTEQQGKKLDTLPIPTGGSCLFRATFCLKKQRFFSHFLEMEIFLSFDIFANYSDIFSYYLLFVFSILIYFKKFL